MLGVCLAATHRSFELPAVPVKGPTGTDRSQLSRALEPKIYPAGRSQSPAYQMLSREMSVERITANGVSLNVDDRGAGKPVVFIHGLGANLESWDQEVKHFSGRFRTIAYDARGHGESTRGTAYSLKDHVEDLRCMLGSLGVERCAVVGASMGSYIAQGFASVYPSRVQELALVVTKSHGTTSSSARILEEHKNALSSLTHRERQEFLLGYAFGPYIEPEKKQAHIRRLMSSLLSEAEMAAAAGALAGFDFRRILPSILAKTVVISGSHDRMNPPSEGAACAACIPASKFIELKRSGHFPSVEETGAYFQALDALMCS